ncbi:MAG: BrxA/BrxB family bacilliredoxin [Bacteroidetes bacterium]|nr:BrxA/BrxB family bacilliredoxin [Bacteroidota bacterium]
MPYPEMMLTPMRAELTSNGFTELKSAEDVENAFQNAEGTMLIVVNSVCGCAAGAARPGVIESLNNEKKPSKLFTVFAGQDLDATATARGFMLPFPPSSPSVALFKDGKIVHMVERKNIEGYNYIAIADNLKTAYNKFC